MFGVHDLRIRTLKLQSYNDAVWFLDLAVLTVIVDPCLVGDDQQVQAFFTLDVVL